MEAMRKKRVYAVPCGESWWKARTPEGHDIDMGVLAARNFQPFSDPAEAILAADGHEATAGPNADAVDLVYLASPYSHPDPEVREERFQAVARHAAKLMRDGVNVFSPISHTHPIAQYDLPQGWEFWERYDRAMLGVCSRMIVLKLDGWKESKGVAAEIAIMQEQGKAVEYQEPDQET
jgi:hypothetical protein